MKLSFLLFVFFFGLNLGLYPQTGITPGGVPMNCPPAPNCIIGNPNFNINDASSNQNQINPLDSHVCGWYASHLTDLDPQDSYSDVFCLRNNLNWHMALLPDNDNNPLGLDNCQIYQHLPVTITSGCYDYSISLSGQGSLIHKFIMCLTSDYPYQIHPPFLSQKTIVENDDFVIDNNEVLHGTFKINSGDPKTWFVLYIEAAPSAVDISQITICASASGNCNCIYPVAFDRNLSTPSVSTDANGNASVIGFYDDTSISFGNNTLYDPNPGVKLFSAKFSALGYNQWAHSISDIAQPSWGINMGRIYQTNSEITYLLINSKGGLKFEDGTLMGSSALNYYSSSVACISQTGTIWWTKTLDESNGNIVCFDQIGIGNQLIITGRADNNTIFDTYFSVSPGLFVLSLDQFGHVQWILQNPSNWDQYSTKLYVTVAQNNLFVNADNHITKVAPYGAILSESVINSPNDPVQVYSFKSGIGNMFYLLSYIDIINNISWYAINGLQMTISPTLQFTPTKSVTGCKTNPSFAPIGNGVVYFNEGVALGPDYNHNYIKRYDMLPSSSQTPIWSDQYATSDYFAVDAYQGKDYGYYLRYILQSNYSSSELGQFDVANGDFVCKTSKNAILQVQPIQDEEIILFPNPTEGKLKVNYAGAYENADVKVFDPMGRIVYTNQQNISNGTIIDLSNLQKGVYIMQLMFNEKEIIKKVIIK